MGGVILTTARPGGGGMAAGEDGNPELVAPAGGDGEPEFGEEGDDEGGMLVRGKLLSKSLTFLSSSSTLFSSSAFARTNASTRFSRSDLFVAIAEAQPLKVRESTTMVGKNFLRKVF